MDDVFLNKLIQEGKIIEHKETIGKFGEPLIEPSIKYELNDELQREVQTSISLLNKLGISSDQDEIEILKFENQKLTKIYGNYKAVIFFIVLNFIWILGACFSFFINKNSSVGALFLLVAIFVDIYCVFFHLKYTLPMAKVKYQKIPKNK